MHSHFHKLECRVLSNILRNDWDWSLPFAFILLNFLQNYLLRRPRESRRRAALPDLQQFESKDLELTDHQQGGHPHGGHGGGAVSRR